MKRKRLLDLTALVITLALLLLSCSSGAPREMTGRLIRDDPRLFVDSLRWSPDSTKILYGGTVWDDLGNSYAEVHAVDVQALSSERIDSLEEAQVTNLQMSPYEETLFYTRLSAPS